MERKMSFFMLLVMMLTLFGCSQKNQPRYYYTAFLIPYGIYGEEDFSEYYKWGVDPNDEQQKMFDEVYENLTSFYGIKKEKPQLKVIEGLTAEDEAYNVYAVYDDKSTIFIDSNLSDKNIPVLAHEMTHYLADKNPENRSLSYNLEDQYTLGFGLTEGVTNYLSTRVYPFAKTESVYEYETHVAEMLVLLMGEEKLEEAYFSSNIDMIREEVTKNIQDVYPDKRIQCFDDTPEVDFTCFDIFVTELDSHHRYLGAVGEVPHAAEDAMNMAESIEETMLKALDHVGKLEEGKKLTQKLIENENEHIPWSQISRLNEMIK